jgi:hypothetical protein
MSNLLREDLVNFPPWRKIVAGRGERGLTRVG